MIEKIAFIHQSAWNIEDAAAIIDSGLPDSVEYGNYRARAYSDNNEARLIATAAELGFYSFDDDELALVDSMMTANVKAVFLCSCELARQLVARYAATD
jgi:hypothetical protein